MKILILSAKTGGGHMRAAEALKAVINQNDADAEVRIVDGLQYVSPSFNKFIVELYKYSATKTPAVYGVFYRLSNKDNPSYKIVKKVNGQFAKRFLSLLKDFQPDVIVTTHPFPSIMMSRLREKGLTNIPVISIITDFAPHKAYLNPGISRYIVSSEQMVDELVNLGVDRKIVHPVGIPIDPIFYELDKHKEESLYNEGFDPNLKTVLIMAGSFGVTDILKIYENINELDLDFQIIVITGRNEKLFDEFNAILSVNENMRVGESQPSFDDEKEPTRKQSKINVTKRTKLIYFTNEVYKYMHMSDLIITKPGGLTVSEALASCLPMAIFKAIPGQESDNSEYLCNNNLAIEIKKSTAADTIYQLLKYPERLISMRESCSRLNNLNSALNVYDIIKDAAAEMTESAVINSDFDFASFELPYLDPTVWDGYDFDEPSYDEFRTIFDKYKDQIIVDDDNYIGENTEN